MKKVLEDKDGYCLNESQVESLPAEEKKKREKEIQLSEYFSSVRHEDEL
jgi:hypothetical protein